MGSHMRNAIATAGRKGWEEKGVAMEQHKCPSLCGVPLGPAALLAAQPFLPLPLLPKST